MIFLSHNWNDKPVVSQIAQALEAKYGRDNVFFDSWSIQPGDGIIDKMNEGLAACKYFFFFVSSHSLTSQMVKLEWQNALMKAAKAGCKFIPVRLDNSTLPALLLQSLYLDLYTSGLDAVVRQIIDVIDGRNTYVSNTTFSNIKITVTVNGGELFYSIEAQYYMEPICKLAFLFANDVNEIECAGIGEGSYSSGKHTNVAFSSSKVSNCIIFAFDRPLTPAFPGKVKIAATNGKPVAMSEVLLITSESGGAVTWKKIL